jgi:hypothetical protein
VQVTQGTWRNFHSGQTSSKRAPSSRTEPHPGRFRQAATPSRTERPGEGIPNRLILPATTGGPHGSTRVVMSRGARAAPGPSGSRNAANAQALSNAMVTSTRRALCKGCNGLPASVMKRLARDARDAPRVRRLLCSSARHRAGSRRRGGHRSERPPETRCLTASKLGKRRSGRICRSRHDRNGHGAAEADRPFIARHRRKKVHRGEGS